MSFSQGGAFCILLTLVVLVIVCLAHMAYLLVREVKYVRSWEAYDDRNAAEDT